MPIDKREGGNTVAKELRIDITSEANEYLRSLAKELVEEVKVQISENKRYLTIGEVCKEFNCSRNTLSLWIADYGLKRIVIGSKVYIDSSDLHDLFAQLKK